MIELPRGARDQAVASIERYFSEECGERIGNIAAGALLNFLVEEVGPVIYNQAVQQVQQQLLERVQEVDIDCHEDEFQYWGRRRSAARGKR